MIISSSSHSNYHKSLPNFAHVLACEEFCSDLMFRNLISTKLLLTWNLVPHFLHEMAPCSRHLDPGIMTPPSFSHQELTSGQQANFNGVIFPTPKPNFPSIMFIVHTYICITGSYKKILIIKTKNVVNFNTIICVWVPTEPTVSFI